MATADEGKEKEGSGCRGSPEDVASWRDARPFWRRLKAWLVAEPPLLNLPTSGPAPKPQKKTGICFSGGGIRSAAYNLGALQVLQEEGVLQKADYLSAVSGGSYIAASYATAKKACSNQDYLKDGPPVYARGSPEEIHLRNHCSYLAPRAGGTLRLLLRLLLGLAVNLAFVGSVVVLAGAAAGLLYAEVLHPELAQPIRVELTIDPWMWILPGAFAGLSVAAMLPDLLARLPEDRLRHALESWAVRLAGLSLLAFGLLVGAPLLLELIRHAAPDVTPPSAATPLAVGTETQVKARGSGFLEYLGLAGVASTALSALAAFLMRRRLYVAIVVGAVAGPLAILASFLLVANEVAVGGFAAADLLWLIVPAAILLLFTIFADITQWSPHPFYRRRLSSAFFVRRTSADKVEEIAFDELIPLENLAPEGSPKVIICAAANLSDEGATPPGRNAASFTFSAREVGGPLVCEVSRRGFEEKLRGEKKEAKEARSRDLTVPAAVAMSGAAVSPVMGKKGVRVLSFLFALANVRLGAWLPNPRWLSELKGRPFLGWKGLRPEGDRSRLQWPLYWARRLVPPPRYIFHEMFGTTSIRHKYLYVTDGGHFENLGLVELLRQGCTTIFCFDASGDRDDTFNTIGESIAIARTDLQVDIEKLEPERMKPGENEAWSKEDHIIGRIRYRGSASGGRGDGDGDGEEGGPNGKKAGEADEPEPGFLVFAKAAVTESAPWDVRAFRLRDKRFPNHSTFDQLFNEEKFEAYRALGAHTTRRAIESFKAKVVRLATEIAERDSKSSRRGEAQKLVGGLADPDVIGESRFGSESARRATTH